MDFFDILLAKKLEDDRDPTIEGLSVTENGIYSETGKAYNPVIVEVPEPTLITKSITANGTYSASDDNADGYSSVTVAVEGFKKKSIANTPTDIASFNDGTANPMPSLEISIEPVQSGSGNPSPQNVRPISGWYRTDISRYKAYQIFDALVDSASDKGVTVTYEGKGKYTVKGTVNESGILSIELPVEEFTIYNGSDSYIKFGNDQSIRFKVKFMKDDVPVENWILVPANRDTGYTAMRGKNVNKIVFEDEMATIGNSYNFSIQIAIYSNDLKKIEAVYFRDASASYAVYGGRLNVTSGKLVVTHANIASYNGETINEPWISSMDVYSAGATPTTGAQVVYPLTTPQTYQLTPTQVSTLLGENNIFADCGQILEGEYFVTL